MRGLERRWSRRGGTTRLFRFVGVACVYLFEVDRSAIDVKPDAGGALECGLVLPALMSATTADDRAEFASKWVVCRSPCQRGSRQKVPRLGKRIPNRCHEVPPPLDRVGRGITDFIFVSLWRTRDTLTALGGHPYGRFTTASSSNHSGS